MILAEICGGLGNQLFQYAAARCLALRLGTKLRLNTNFYRGEQRGESFAAYRRSFQLSQFRVCAKEASQAELEAFLGSERPMSLLSRLRNHMNGMRRFPPRVVHEDRLTSPETFHSLPNNSYLKGYWQDPLYFACIRSALLRELTVRDPRIRRFADQVIRQFQQDGQEVVGVHMRAGDVQYANDLLNRPDAVPYVPMSLDYFLTAIGRFPENCVFVICSDSAQDQLEWEKRLPGRRVVVSPGKSDLEDFALLQRCDHLIISNSTFSWWPAWLNSSSARRVIAPRSWYREGYSPAPSLQRTLPSEWEVI